jgi:hypothetical protein
MKMTVHARVKNGRLLVDEPTDLPDGTELVLVPAGEEQQAPDQTPAEAAHPAAQRLARAGGTGPRARAPKRSAWKR